MSLSELWNTSPTPEHACRMPHRQACSAEASFTQYACNILPEQHFDPSPDPVRLCSTSALKSMTVWSSRCLGRSKRA